jgi:hypothetical protein
MISIWAVQGSVLVEDRKQQYLQEAQVGLQLDPMGDYLIATTPASSVRLSVDGELIDLPPNSFLRAGPGTHWSGRHNVPFMRTDLRGFLGRIWAKLAQEPRERETANAAIGIRG